MEPLHLVDDEIIQIHASRFRIQNWRAAGLTPIVVFIQLPNEVHPRMYASCLAQTAILRFLACSEPLPTFFSYGTHRSDGVAHKITYDVFGRPDRPLFRQPKFVRVDSSTIERAFRLKPVSC
jgi:hypothetical protein